MLCCRRAGRRDRHGASWERRSSEAQPQPCAHPSDTSRENGEHAAAVSSRYTPLRRQLYLKSRQPEYDGQSFWCTREQRIAQNTVRHSPRCPTYSRNSTERREDVRSKRHDIEVRGAVKPARAIAHDEASSAGLSQWEDLENWLQDHKRGRAVPITVSSTSLFEMTWLVEERDAAAQTVKKPHPSARKRPVGSKIRLVGSMGLAHVVKAN